MLLCEKVDNHKSIEEWAYMYNNAKLYMDRYEAIQKLAKSDEAIATKTMTSALNDHYPYLKKNCYSKNKEGCR